MSRSARTQREWLVEDLDQIRRHFPGATIVEAFSIPFDFQPKTKTRAQHGRERKASGRVRADSEQSDTVTRRERRQPAAVCRATCRASCACRCAVAGPRDVARLSSRMSVFFGATL